MIRRLFIKRQLQELFKGQAFIDLVFQRRVGVDAEPLLEDQTFKKQELQVGVGAFSACANSVMAHQYGFDSCPVDAIRDFFIQS